MKIESSVEKMYRFSFSFTQDEFDLITSDLDNHLGHNTSLSHSFWTEFYNAMAEHYED
jgi:hypothetical protein